MQPETLTDTFTVTKLNNINIYKHRFTDGEDAVGMFLTDVLGKSSNKNVQQK